ncbi:MAG: serine/threonine-protein kinase [Myxococcota bacterium]
MVELDDDDATLAAFDDASAPGSSREDGDVPSVVGRFTVLGRLGAGGMGEVLTAYDERLDRRVAVKVVHRGSLGTLAQERMLREAQALAKVSHPNVVAVHEVGEHDGDLYIAMELIEGQTLAAWVDAQPRGWADVLEVYGQAAAGLAASHAAGLVHRDFKPENAIVGTDGRVRVLDFGLSRQAEAGSHADAAAPDDDDPTDLSPNSDRLTATGTTAGTPAYMAPEQVMLKPLGPATDQFSFCVSLWGALYGQRPFSGGHRMALFAAVIDGAIDDPPSGSDVPAYVERALRRGLNVDPNARWPSMNALMQALSRDRAPWRRRALLVGVAGSAVLGGLAGGLSWANALQRAPCPPGADEMAALWTPEREAALTRRISGSPAYVQATWRTVSGRIDALTQTWAERWDKACQASDAAQHDPQRICLERRRTQLDAALTRIETGDAEAWASQALEATLMGDLDDCARRTASVAEAELPQSARDEARALRATLVRITAATHQSAPLAGLDEIGPLVTQARTLDDPTVLADVLHTQAKYLFAVGRADEARQANDESVLLSEANRYDTGAARGLVFALRLLFRGERDAAAARALLPRVEAAIARAGNRRSDRVALASLQAELERDTGNADAARTHAARALSLAEQRFGPEDARIVLPLQLQASVHLRSGDVPTALVNHARAATLIERAGGPTHPALATALDGLGHSQYNDDRWQEGIATYARAASVLEPLYPDGSSQLAWTYVKLTQGYWTSGDVAKAHRFATKGMAMLEAVEGHDSPNLSGALTLAARFDRLDGDHASAVAKLTRASDLVFGRDNAAAALLSFSIAMRCAADEGLPLDLAPLEHYVSALRDEDVRYRTRALAAHARLLASRGEATKARDVLKLLEPPHEDPPGLNAKIDVFVAYATLHDDASRRWWTRTLEAIEADTDEHSTWGEYAVQRVVWAEHAPADADRARIERALTPARERLEDCCATSSWTARAQRVLEAP